MTWACETCPKRFGTYHALTQHARALGHSARQYDCRSCEFTFPNNEERRCHEAEEHSYCTECNRGFQNANNLRMHLHSRKHQGANLKCPFCKIGFTSATGLAHHLEQGSCRVATGLDRDKVYAAVRAKDPDGVLSKKLIGWHGSATYEATSSAWNGDAWECYLCHKCFNTINGLNNHLSSPFHQRALYHCPNRNRCGRDFKTLAAVMNHLESESCGFSRFEAVQNTVSNVVSGDRLLTFG
ncbi:hypothetical protein F5B19DRAFT_124203 [Rostrohypoxylon terebratum]|nr:hypothetical protein F5B19DRAFT_124203 [Rostrohypoxylon terebratum]